MTLLDGTTSLAGTQRSTTMLQVEVSEIWGEGGDDEGKSFERGVPGSRGLK